MFKFIACFHPSIYNTIWNGLCALLNRLTPRIYSSTFNTIHITLNNKVIYLLGLIFWNIFFYIFCSLKLVRKFATFIALILSISLGKFCCCISFNLGQISVLKADISGTTYVFQEFASKSKIIRLAWRALRIFSHLYGWILVGKL